MRFARCAGGDFLSDDQDDAQTGGLSRSDVKVRHAGGFAHLLVPRATSFRDTRRPRTPRRGRLVLLAREIFARLGRPGQKAIYGLANLARHHKREDIERACEKVLTLSQPSYQALKRILEHCTAASKASAAADEPVLRQQGEHIRGIQEYQAFWNEYCQRATVQSNTDDPSTTTHR